MIHVLVHLIDHYLTFLRRGFAFFEAGDALRLEAASIAPAFFIGMPCFAAILA